MANPTLTRPTRPAAVVREATDTRSTSTISGGDLAGAHAPHNRVRSRVRTQWLVLAAALTVLAGLLVAWGLTAAGDRVDVVSVARPVAAGSVLQLDDLTITAIAIDSSATGAGTGLVPATSLGDLVGRAATIDLQPGTLLTVGMWADGSTLTADERTVGAVLKPGRHPAGLTQGMHALALSLDDDLPGVTVRVLATEPAQTAGLAITLAVADADATRIARLGATDRLVLVGLPTVAASSGTP
jgi:SAF domain